MATNSKSFDAAFVSLLDALSGPWDPLNWQSTKLHLSPKYH